MEQPKAGPEGVKAESLGAQRRPPEREVVDDRAGGRSSGMCLLDCLAGLEVIGSGPE